jgi:hypothetical protein
MDLRLSISERWSLLREAFLRYHYTVLYRTKTYTRDRERVVAPRQDTICITSPWLTLKLDCRMLCASSSTCYLLFASPTEYSG